MSDVLSGIMAGYAIGLVVAYLTFARPAEREAKDLKNTLRLVRRYRKTIEALGDHGDESSKDTRCQVLGHNQGINFCSDPATGLISYLEARCNRCGEGFTHRAPKENKSHE